ncbi:MAG TPA: hypothetical protein VGS22_12435 [Thermoanaerobaculia bacterium]|jgi:hypothetical protein|nr:hypothetical protein [Thermoanaerobaculia bacterium]
MRSLRLPCLVSVAWSVAALAPAAAATHPGLPGRPDFVATATPRSVDVDLRTLPVVPDWKPGDPFFGEEERFEPMGLPPRAPVPRRDPLLDIQANAPAPSARAFTSPLVNFAGMTTGAQPPDTTGDVGPNHYIQVVNGAGARFTIYRKSDGAVLSGPTNLTSLGTGSCASGIGDGIVLYDSLAGRWVLSQIRNGANLLCVFVSKTGDPIAGGWWAYQFSTPAFPDYPKYAVWPNAYVATSNEGGATTFPAVYALDRTQMLAGLPATLQRFVATRLTGFSFQVLTPADADGAAPPAGAPAYLLRHRDDEEHSPGTADPSQDFIELYSLQVDFATPANSLFSGPTSIPVAEFDSSFCGSDTAATSCIPQTTGTHLDALREPIMNRVQYRNFGGHETLVGNFITDVDGADRAGIRWFELRKIGAGAWSLFQEGTYSPDATRRWIGSIAMDQAGDIALGYSASSTTVSPSSRYTGRLAGDPLGTLPQGENSMQAGTGTNPSSRWGDYAAMTVDPADDCTFWFTTEHTAGSGTATRIAAFKFDNCPVVAPSTGLFFTVAPCRVVDTRIGSGGILSSGVPSSYPVAASCGIPLTARAVAANVTVVGPTGPGVFTLYPNGSSPPATATLNFGAGQTRANNAILSLGPDGAIAVSPFVAGGGQAHLVLDVAGYFE